MKALQLVAWKHAPEFRDVADPEPGPGEVVVRVGGAGACHSDLHLLDEFEEGVVPFTPPFTLGHENAGWIDSVGAGVTDLEPGLPVAVYGPWGCGRCANCRVGMENYCLRPAEIGAGVGGLGRDGGMAAKLLVPNSRLVVPIGDLDPVQAAPLTDAGLTPYHAIKRSLHLLGAGSSVVVIGAGGLGHMAIQFLRELSGATIVAVDQRQEALDLAVDIGAHHGVLASDDAASEVRDLTGGIGAEVVIDCVGAQPTVELGAAVAKVLGHLTIVGIGGGVLPVGFFTVPYEVSVATTYWGGITELMEVITLAQQGRVGAHVTTVGLDEGPGVYDRLRAGEIRGRAVIVPN